MLDAVMQLHFTESDLSCHATCPRNTSAHSPSTLAKQQGNRDQFCSCPVGGSSPPLIPRDCFSPLDDGRYLARRAPRLLLRRQSGAAISNGVLAVYEIHGGPQYKNRHVPNEDLRRTSENSNSLRRACKGSVL